jgi:DNA-binding response OmpR family regulator
MAKILIVEDDKKLAAALVENLSSHRYAAEHTAEAIVIASRSHHQSIVAANATLSPRDRRKSAYRHHC